LALFELRLPGWHVRGDLVMTTPFWSASAARSSSVAMRALRSEASDDDLPLRVGVERRVGGRRQAIDEVARVAGRRPGAQAVAKLAKHASVISN
jgi:hypothetical protein